MYLASIKSTEIAMACIIKTNNKDNDILNKLCIPYEKSKSTWVVRHNISITVISNKLKEVQADLFGLHNQKFQLRSIYTAIFISKYTWKT